MQTKGVQRIFDHFRECAVLLFKADMFFRQSDLIMIFTYIPPENSPVYKQEDNSIILLNKNINEISLCHPDADLFFAGVL